MRADPFYEEFLAYCDMRYFIGGSVRNDSRENVFVAVQRARSQDHVTPREIALYETLLPHVQLSYDVMRRLEGRQADARSLADALEWIEDGVLTLGRDGQVLRANAAAETMLRQGDGVQTKTGAIDFTSTEARNAFLRALRSLDRVATDPSRPGRLDFLVGRPDSDTPYVVSLRPVSSDGTGLAKALMFIRDPLRSSRASTFLLRRAFGLTAAQANLAAALVDGLTPDAYAVEQGLSRNTVYAHLRAIKAKCGEGRLVALIRRFQTAVTPARPADGGSE